MNIVQYMLGQMTWNEMSYFDVIIPYCEPYEKDTKVEYLFHNTTNVPTHHDQHHVVRLFGKIKREKILERFRVSK